MASLDLTTDEGLLEACKQAEANIDRAEIATVAQFLERVHSVVPEDRSGEKFVRLVWQQNPLAELGHGDYALEGAYKDADFRDEFAKAISQTLPKNRQQRLDAINGLVTRTQEMAQKFVKPDKTGRRVRPVSKTLRALTALLPFDLTPTTYVVTLNKLAIAMDLPSRTGTDTYTKYAEKSREIIERLDKVLGPLPESDWTALATRRLLARGLESLSKPTRAQKSKPEPPTRDDIARELPMPPGRIAETIERFNEFRRREGLVFDTAMIEALHLGLWANERRHFAVLTGLSGTGKTKLARLYGRALTGGEARNHVRVFSVEPGWHDPSHLLGFVNPLSKNQYQSTPFLEFLMAAKENPSTPYVAVLDEMNLSHPEQYLAPLLSAMESDGGDVHLHMLERSEAGIPQSIHYPANLVLIGTVNMDETTMGLSDKVLDRAFTLEFWDVEVDRWPGWKNAELGARKDDVKSVLNSLMKVLRPARLHFGWRVIEEIVRFMERWNRDKVKMLKFAEALDIVIYAKVLPKLRGDDSPRYRKALEALVGKQGSDGVLNKSLPKSQAKVKELQEDLDNTGSFRFWR